MLQQHLVSLFGHIQPLIQLGLLDCCADVIADGVEQGYVIRTESAGLVTGYIHNPHNLILAFERHADESLEPLYIDQAGMGSSGVF